MSKYQKLSLFVLRIALGWLFFYAGITKVLDPAWSAEGYLKNAKALTGLYEMFLQPNILPIINFMNEWGLTLLGISLILGIFVRISAILGIVLMLLYYLPLGFPHPSASAYIVDQHIIYIIGLFILLVFRSERIIGLEGFFKKLSFFKKNSN